MSHNIIIYEDIVAFHPGFYLKDLMEFKEISAEDFAKESMIPTEDVEKIIQGDMNLTTPLMIKIAAATRTSSKFWYNLQNEFNRKVFQILHRDF